MFKRIKTEAFEKDFVNLCAGMDSLTTAINVTK